MTHLVLIVADTLRSPSTIPGYVPERVTPFLAQQRGRVLSMQGAIASSAWTVPSHASLLSGVDPWDMHYHGAVLRVPQGKALGSRWHEAGGESAAYSANGLVSPDYGLLQEYDQVNPFAFNRIVAPRIWGLIQPMGARGMDPTGLVATGGHPRPSAPRSNIGNLPVRLAGKVGNLGVHALLSGRGIVSGIDRFLRRRRTDRPLHLFVNLMEAHEPYTISPLPKGPRLPREVFLPIMSLSRSLEVLEACGNCPAMLVRAYLEAVRRFDDRLQDLFKTLATRGILQDATVVLVSDHGQALGEHGFFGHGHSVQDEIARVPCYVWRFRRGEHAISNESSPSAPFDLRHLHDALTDLTDRDPKTTVTQGVESALVRRGPGLCYWEGPGLRQLGTPLAEQGQASVVRRLRLFLEGKDVVVEQGLTEEEGHVVLRPPPAGTSGELERKAFEILERSRSSSPGSRELDRSVEQRLRTWGYA